MAVLSYLQEKINSYHFKNLYFYKNSNQINDV